jgi:hypothetical protein
LVSKKEKSNKRFGIALLKFLLQLLGTLMKEELSDYSIEAIFLVIPLKGAILQEESCSFFMLRARL